MLYDNGEFLEGIDLSSFEVLAEENKTRKEFQELKRAKTGMENNIKKLKPLRKVLCIQLKKCEQNISIFEYNMQQEYNNKNMVEANEWKKKMENELFIKETLEENILAIDEKLSEYKFFSAETEEKIENLREEYDPGSIIWDHINCINFNNPAGYQVFKLNQKMTGSGKLQKIVLSEYSKRRNNINKHLKEKFEKMQESPNNAKKVFGFLGEYLKDTFL
jgi:hypothetical protein